MFSQGLSAFKQYKRGGEEQEGAQQAKRRRLGDFMSKRTGGGGGARGHIGRVSPVAKQLQEEAAAAASTAAAAASAAADAHHRACAAESVSSLVDDADLQQLLRGMLQDQKLSGCVDSEHFAHTNTPTTLPCAPSAPSCPSAGRRRGEGAASPWADTAGDAARALRWTSAEEEQEEEEEEELIGSGHMAMDGDERAWCSISARASPFLVGRGPDAVGVVTPTASSSAFIRGVGNGVGTATTISPSPEYEDENEKEWGGGMDVDESSLDGFDGPRSDHSRSSSRSSSTFGNPSAFCSIDEW